jgi:hypothetical protein
MIEFQNTWKKNLQYYPAKPDSGNFKIQRLSPSANPQHIGLIIDRKMMIQFLFRRPRFPVICDAHGVLIGAMTPRQLSDQFALLEVLSGEQLPLIDTNAEGWVLDADSMVISPLTFKKSWTKKEVIKVFNASKTANQAGLEYSGRSLSSKKFDQIIIELVKLILIANKPLRVSDAFNGKKTT